ncbi:hypothetical protein EZV62_014554 [Acer yangbiense]|uniref:DUF4283 domain-containing protein n=1 Tax=Acer yangbiense TaxID=1000413 RepID=A0A5C7HSH6_9ROSI|nr:hypothetical protein EZV62_014554 [Acer yangbiense]
MNSEDIASLYASLSISSCDGPVQLLDGKLIDDARHRLSLCMVGIILSSKWVNRDAFMRVIGKIWQVKQGLDIESVSRNTFTFHFRDEYDLNSVISRGLWSFDNALIVMEKPVGIGNIDSLSFSQADFWAQIHQVPILCMTKEIGRFLGGIIGEVLDVDGGNSGDGTETIMVLRYERLPNHCFKCGLVNHSTSECAESDSIPIVNGKKEPIYGPWLRVSGSMRRSNFQSQSRMITNASSQVREEDVTGRESTSMPKLDGSQKQEDMAVDSESLGKEEVMSQEIGSISVSIISHQLEEEVNNLNSNGTASAAINGEEIVGIASGLGSIGCCEKNIGTPPINQDIHTPSKWIVSEANETSMKASSDPFESIVKSGPILGFVEEKPIDNISSSLSFSDSPSLTNGSDIHTNQVEEDKRGCRSNRIRKLGIFKKELVVYCGKRKTALVENDGFYGSRKTRKMDEYPDT